MSELQALEPAPAISLEEQEFYLNGGKVTVVPARGRHRDPKPDARAKEALTAQFSAPEQSKEGWLYKVGTTVRIKNRGEDWLVLAHVDLSGSAKFDDQRSPRGYRLRDPAAKRNAPPRLIREDSLEPPTDEKPAPEARANGSSKPATARAPGGARKNAPYPPNAVCRLTEKGQTNPKKPGNKNHPWYQTMMDTIIKHGGSATVQQIVDADRKMPMMAEVVYNHPRGYITVEAPTAAATSTEAPE